MDSTLSEITVKLEPEDDSESNNFEEASCQYSLIQLEDEDSESQEHKVKENTKKQIRLWIRVLGDYASTEGINIAEAATLSNPDLDSFLCRFYLNVRKVNGGKYSEKSMHALRFGINRHFFTVYGRDISNKRTFKKSSRVLKSILRDLRNAGLGTVVGKYTTFRPRAFSTAALSKLRASENMDIETPVGLQNKVLLDVMLLKKSGNSVLNLWGMSRRAYMVDVDENGRRFLAKRESGIEANNVSVTDTDGATSHPQKQSHSHSSASGDRLYELPGCRDCPVSSFLNYTSKLNPSIPCLWQRPRAIPRSKLSSPEAEDESGTDSIADVWYEPFGIGKGSLRKRFHALCHTAVELGLNGGAKATGTAAVTDGFGDPVTNGNANVCAKTNPRLNRSMVASNQSSTPTNPDPFHGPRVQVPMCPQSSVCTRTQPSNCLPKQVWSKSSSSTSTSSSTMPTSLHGTEANHLSACTPGCNLTKKTFVPLKSCMVVLNKTLPVAGGTVYSSTSTSSTIRPTLAQMSHIAPKPTAPSVSQRKQQPNLAICSPPTQKQVQTLQQKLAVCRCRLENWQMKREMMQLQLKYNSACVDLRRLRTPDTVSQEQKESESTFQLHRTINDATSGPTERKEYEQGYAVDFRSDTITRPTEAMRNAMSEAVVGDDVFGEDPTVNELQQRVAKLLKKEAALFVPSGTMSNLIALMAHCSGRGDEILLGDSNHIILWEQGGMAQIAGVCPRTVRTLPDGTYDLEEVESKIRSSDIHMPVTKLICLENTHNSSGGRALPLEFFKKVRALADKHNLKVHLDGARLLNAAVALGVTPDVITQYVDSISLCFSKGLGCPVGSILVGANDFIGRGLRHRKVLGGGMRQCGILAAAALVGLDQGYARLHVDHDNAQKLAKGLKELGTTVFTAEPSNTQTNMVHVVVRDDIPIMQAAQLLGNVAEDEVTVLGKSIQVKMFPETKHTLRAVMNHHVTETDVNEALRKFRFIADKLEKNGFSN